MVAAAALTITILDSADLAAAATVKRKPQVNPVPMVSAVVAAVAAGSVVIAIVEIAAATVAREP